MDHFAKGNRITVPYGIAFIANYCKNKFKNNIDIHLFKHPEILMKKIIDAPPDILALSFYMWNENLSLEILKCCKIIKPNTVTVLGGPSISRVEVKYSKILRDNKDVDILTLDLGEQSFSNIVEYIFSTDQRNICNFQTPIDGCALRIDNNNESIIRGETENKVKELEIVESPYLNGSLDEFLEQGFLPQLETNRGCPYQCVFCQYGDTFRQKLMIRDENIIKEELLYLSKNCICLVKRLHFDAPRVATITFDNPTDIRNVFT